MLIVETCLNCSFLSLTINIVSLMEKVHQIQIIQFVLIIFNSVISRHNTMHFTYEILFINFLRYYGTV